MYKDTNDYMVIKAYTDGACSGNPGRGGIGAVILADGEEIARLCDGRRKTTNNRMELLAAIKAIETVVEWLENNPKRKDVDVKTTVFSDSQLLVNTINKGWTRRTNKDLWSRLDCAVEALESETGVPLSFEKVRGHSGDRYNDVADSLAVEGSRRFADTPDIVYEDICKQQSAVLVPRPVVESVPEPEVKDILLCGHDDPANRRVEVTLSNGTVVKIGRCHEGFQQYDATEREMRITADIAWRFVGWLNGRSL